MGELHHAAAKPTHLNRRHSIIARDPPPDLSYPSLTTDVERIGFTNEYRVTSNKGYVDAPLANNESEIGTTSHGLAEKGTAQPHDLKLVTFKPGDERDPRNWSKLFRWVVTLIVGMAVVQVSCASAIITGDFSGPEEEFGVSNEVMALTVSLMVVGFGIGPLAWSPLSELYGRRVLWIFPSLVYTVLIIPCALAPNIGCLLACRFLCGIFSSAPLTLAGGAISDIWGPDERGLAIALFAMAPYGGAVLGPLIGGFVGEGAGWRAIFWVNLGFAGLMLILTSLIPETYVPTILRRRAIKLRAETGDDTFVTEQEVHKRPLSEIIVETLIRPFQMLTEEPILILMSLYIALIYGLLYAFFFSFPIVFGEGYGFSDGKIGLTFCSVLIGAALALVATLMLEKRYMIAVRSKGGKADPEDRLPGMMLGAPFIPISLFIFGWTAPPYVMPHGASWLGPCSSGIPFGFGMVVIYFGANAYLIDAFPSYVASALAAKTVVRSGMGAAMPLFITPMFHNLTNGGAASLLAGISILMVPIPFLFYRYGKQIRARSKRAVV